MKKFMKGQLVAVRDCGEQNWTLRVFDHYSESGQIFCRRHDGEGPAIWWSEVKPAEEVWPHIFFGREGR